MAHRLAICAAFAEGVSRIHALPSCEDVEATLACLDAFSVKYERCGNVLTVYGGTFRKPTAPLRVGASASTLRFFIPMALLLRCEMTFIGETSLFSRPLTVYERLFASLSCPFVLSENSLYVDARGLGGLPRHAEMDGSISSQFVTGLLLLYAISGGGEIALSGKVESRPYIDLTLDVLGRFGVKGYFTDERTIVIAEGQRLHALECEVEGDYSGSAFLEALNLIGGDVTVLGLSEDSRQGDRVYREYFKMLRDGVPVIDIGDTPDLAPILMVAASEFHGARLLSSARLKIKESDRGRRMAEELRKFGASITVLENEIVIEKSTLHTPREVLFGHGDHRIVMALSVLLTKYGGELSGAEAIAKSFPDFYEKLKTLGIKYQMKP